MWPVARKPWKFEADFSAAFCLCGCGTRRADFNAPNCLYARKFADSISTRQIAYARKKSSFNCLFAYTRDRFQRGLLLICLRAYTHPRPSAGRPARHPGEPGRIGHVGHSGARLCAPRSRAGHADPCQGASPCPPGRQRGAQHRAHAVQRPSARYATRATRGGARAIGTAARRRAIRVGVSSHGARHHQGAWHRCHATIAVRPVGLAERRGQARTPGRPVTPRDAARGCRAASPDQAWSGSGVVVMSRPKMRAARTRIVQHFGSSQHTADSGAVPRGPEEVSTLMVAGAAWQAEHQSACSAPGLGMVQLATVRVRQVRTVTVRRMARRHCRRPVTFARNVYPAGIGAPHNAPGESLSHENPPLIDWSDDQRDNPDHPRGITQVARTSG